METKLFDSELRLMELLWEKSGSTAKELATAAAVRIGWSKNTTYTVTKKLVAKGVIRREEPNFVCVPLLTREQVIRTEADVLVNKFFDGSVKRLFASFLSEHKLSDNELNELRQMIDSRSKPKGE